MIKKSLTILFIFVCLFQYSGTQNIKKKNYQTFDFGERGQIKMLYDRRQRPQSVFLNGRVYIVLMPEPKKEQLISQKQNR